MRTADGNPGRRRLPAVGTIRHALVVASDADPGHGMAPGFPFEPAAAAIVCGWRPGAEGIQDLRFANRADAEDSGDGLRATVALEGRGNLLTIDQDPEFAAAAGTWAAEVAAKLLADHGMAASDVDLVVATPLARDFLYALAGGLGVTEQKLVAPAKSPAGPHGGPRRGAGAAGLARRVRWEDDAPGLGGRWPRRRRRARAPVTAAGLVSGPRSLVEHRRRGPPRAPHAGARPRPLRRRAAPASWARPRPPDC
jgi:hypothetical protein